MKMKMGIFGGTFDPIHIGHMIVAMEAYDKLNLDEVRFMPSGDSWQKTDVVADVVERCTMVGLATARHRQWATVDPRETMRTGPTYTAETLDEIHALHPDWDLWLILGADVDTSTWHREQDVHLLSTVVKFERWPNISSTDVRERIAAGRPVAPLLDYEVWEYIQQTGLYGACDHRKCCTVHNTHTMPHKGCVLR